MRCFGSVWVSVGECGSVWVSVGEVWVGLGESPTLVNALLGCFNSYLVTVTRRPLIIFTDLVVRLETGREPLLKEGKAPG